MALRHSMGMPYVPAEDRYDDQLPYRRSGRSGLKLPAVSLGLWHNFGDDDRSRRQRAIVRRAFDLGITHFDLANNYGPPPGSAEDELRHAAGAATSRRYRDELVISTKAGYDMWPGPYGEWGSRKYLLSSLDQSLQRMGLDYVDIFYSPPPRPRHAAGGDDGRARRRGASRARRCTSASPTTPAERTARGRRRSCASWASRCSSTSRRYSHAQPLDRGGPARRAGARGHRLHRVLAAGPGPAHRQYLGGMPGGLARRRGPLPDHGHAHAETLRHVRGAQRDRPASAASRWRRWRSRGCCATRA